MWRRVNKTAKKKPQITTTIPDFEKDLGSDSASVLLALTRMYRSPAIRVHRSSSSISSGVRNSALRRKTNGNDKRRFSELRRLYTRNLKKRASSVIVTNPPRSRTRTFMHNVAGKFDASSDSAIFLEELCQFMLGRADRRMDEGNH